MPERAQNPELRHLRPRNALMKPLQKQSHLWKETLQQLVIGSSIAAAGEAAATSSNPAAAPNPKP